MKKLSVILCAATAASLLTLTACGDMNTDQSDSTSGVVGGLISQLIYGTGASDEGSAQASANTSGNASAEAQSPSASVTETEWRTAFSAATYDNCTVVLSAEDEDGNVMTVTLRSDKPNDRYYMLMTETRGTESNTHEAMCAKIENKYYGYEKSPEDGKWYRREINKSTFDDNYGQAFENYLMVAEFVDNYGEFDFDDRTGKYVASDIGIDDATCDVTVTFSDKKMTAMTIKAVSGEEEYNYAVTATSYGTTTIDLPEEYEGA